MQNHRLLPPEIWLEIFDWAMYNPNFPIGESTPFQQISRGPRLPDPNLQVRATLSLVCRTWRVWAAQSLYRDILVGHDTNVLHKVLSAGEISGRRYREMVHRVVLPYHSTVPGPRSPLKSVEILQMCPSLHTLHRPQDWSADNLRFDYEAVGASLPSLQRLEWWYHNEAERSGGINSLAVVLHGAPNLRYLFVGGAVDVGSVGRKLEPILLPNLRTFRLNIRSGLLLRQIISRWTLPSLTHLILDSPPVRSGLEDIWEKFGHQLEIVEFGKHVLFHMNDDLSPCLNGCPNLRQLNFYFFFTSTPQTMQVHPNISVVCLHSDVNGLLSTGDSLWSLIESHFEILCSTKLPGLQRVVLYGNWKPILGHRRFGPMRDKLWQSGRVLELPDQTHI